MKASERQALLEIIRAQSAGLKAMVTLHVYPTDVKKIEEVFNEAVSRLDQAADAINAIEIEGND